MKSTNNTTRFVAPNATARRNSTGFTQQGGSRGSNFHTAANSAMPTAAASSLVPAGSGSPGLESLEALRVPLTATVPLIDPTLSSGLIQVPVTKTMDTKGRTEFFQGILRKDVSLCCLFQKGRCHAAEKCHQIHVDGTFIKNVRTQNAHVISCCRACKDTASLTASAVTFFATHCDQPTVRIVAPDGRFSQVANTQIAITIGLTQHVEQLRAGASLTCIPAKKMCRLHLRGACKYGKDCKNVHLCSKLGEVILVPTHSPLPEERNEVVASNSSISSSVRTSRTPTPTPALACAVAGIMDRNRSGSTAPRVVVGSSSSSLSAPASRRDSLASTASAASASASVVSDAPKDYFSESRFQTPPPSALGEDSALSHSDSPKTSAQEADALERPLSFSQVDLTNISFLDNSLAMSGLCFDPAMALSMEDTEPKHQAKKLSAEWFDDCGCSSTNSQHTLTPSKMPLW